MIIDLAPDNFYEEKKDLSFALKQRKEMATEL